MPYVNPIPSIDTGKIFEMRLVLHFDEPVPVGQAKLQTAKYILEQDPDTLASWISCASIKAMYPNDLTTEQKRKFSLLPDAITKTKEDPENG